MKVRTRPPFIPYMTVTCIVAAAISFGVSSIIGLTNLLGVFLVSGIVAAITGVLVLMLWPRVEGD